MVLLTPGPYNETYFEHSFLAKTFSIPLVEGPDLTVRHKRVFLKTLEGLEPVDLILRRQDDNFCDPIELRGDSMLGVPGLLSAVRAGNVVIANALGSGLIETPASLQLHLDQTITSLSAFEGLLSDSTTRGHGWPSSKSAVVSNEAFKPWISFATAWRQLKFEAPI